MAGIAVTRNPLFVSFDSKLRARLSKGASALIPKTWTRVLMIADPEEKTLTFTTEPASDIPIYRWKRDQGIRIPAGKFAFDLLGMDPQDVVGHRFAVAKTKEGRVSITIYLSRKIR